MSTLPLEIPWDVQAAAAGFPHHPAIGLFHGSWSSSETYDSGLIDVEVDYDLQLQVMPQAVSGGSGYADFVGALTTYAGGDVSNAIVQSIGPQHLVASQGGVTDLLGGIEQHPQSMKKGDKFRLQFALTNHDGISNRVYFAAVAKNIAIGNPEGLSSSATLVINGGAISGGEYKIAKFGLFAAKAGFSWVGVSMGQGGINNLAILSRHEGSQQRVTKMIMPARAGWMVTAGQDCKCVSAFVTHVCRPGEILSVKGDYDFGDYAKAPQGSGAAAFYPLVI